MRITIVISVRQTGHPAAFSDTCMAHGSQKHHDNKVYFVC